MIYQLDGSCTVPSFAILSQGGWFSSRRRWAASLLAFLAFLAFLGILVFLLSDASLKLFVAIDLLGTFVLNTILVHQPNRLIEIGHDANRAAFTYTSVSINSETDLLKLLSQLFLNLNPFYSFITSLPCGFFLFWGQLARFQYFFGASAAAPTGFFTVGVRSAAFAQTGFLTVGGSRAVLYNTVFLILILIRCILIRCILFRCGRIWNCRA